MTTPEGRRPSEDEDRRLEELLGELRIVLPGVTVLFAFLLSLPFTTRFGSATVPQRAAYFTAFLSSAGSIVFLTAETAYHHVVRRPYEKAQMVSTVSRQILAALVLLGLALGSVVFLVTDVLYGTRSAVPITAGLSALLAGTWFALPRSRRRRTRL